MSDKQNNSIATNTNSTGDTNDNATNVARFVDAQRDRTLVHSRIDNHSTQPYSFVVAADTQFGMTRRNRDWEFEKELSIRAVDTINGMQPRPLFCVVCGDLSEMEPSMYVGQRQPDSNDELYTREDCERIQSQQWNDFQSIWSAIHPDIALVCVCGNHDVGNRPTAASTKRFTNAFGDDYLSFTTNSVWNICLNSNLFNDPTTDNMDLHDRQWEWLQRTLQGADTKSRPSMTFVFSHHPWFLYDEKEDASTMGGVTEYTNEEGLIQRIPDSYFHFSARHRTRILELFRKHNVTACFAGHFHQNAMSKTTWGMDMIVTGPLSELLQSSGNPTKTTVQGLRVVQVNPDTRTFQHEFVELSSTTGTRISFDSSGDRGTAM